MLTSASFQDVRAAWRSVRVMEATIEVNTGPLLFTLVPHATGFARVPESLLLVFAVSVVEQALLVYRDDGAFASKSSKLSSLMLASRDHLSWQAYSDVDAIRLRRNQVAHEGELLHASECSAALTSIARELLAWGALEADYAGEYSVSMSPSQSGRGEQ